MIHFTVKDKDNNKLKLSAPTSWDELTLDQFMKIEGAQSNNVIELFSILTGVVSIDVHIVMHQMY